MSASIHHRWNRRRRSDRRSVLRATFLRCCVPLLALLAGGCEKPAADSSDDDETPAATATDTAPPANPLSKTGGAESKPAGPPAQRARVPAANSGKVPFTISKETTFVVEPLRADGVPDYAAALDAMAGEGVTPENNAVVSYWRAIGPKPIDPSLRADYFAKLGMDVPPEKGEYLVGLKEFAEEYAARQDPPLPFDEQGDLVQTIYKQQHQAATAPWTERDLPAVAEWLRRNERPLALVLEGSSRSKYFAPVYFGQRQDGEPPPAIVEALMVLAMDSREMARLLTARAMLRLGEGRRAEAEADLLACRRVGRQMTHGWSLIDQLVGIAIEAIAMEAEAALAHHGQPTVEQARDYIVQLDRLPPRRPMADAFDSGERFGILDSICRIALYGPDSLAEEMGRAPAISDAIKDSRIDWDIALRKGNALFDDIARAARAATRAERKERLDAIEQDFKKKQAELSGAAAAARMLVAPSEMMGDVLVMLLAPASSTALAAEDMAAMRFELARLAFALAAHRAEHGEYPAAVDALAPKYLSAVPEDIFSGGSLVYRRTADRRGCVLYSVGPNGEDDGGMLQYEDPFSDDLVIRMSPSARE